MSTWSEVYDQIIDFVSPYIIDRGGDLIRSAPRYLLTTIQTVETKYNFRYMEASLETETLSDSDNKNFLANVPDDLKGFFDQPYYSQNSAKILLEWKTHRQSTGAFYLVDQIGNPIFLVEDSRTIEVFPEPDKEYAIHIPYYKRTVSGDIVAGDSHWLTRNALQFLTYATAGEMLRYIPGQEQNAERMALSGNSLFRPRTLADKYMLEAVRMDKREGLAAVDFHPMREDSGEIGSRWPWLPGGSTTGSTTSPSSSSDSRTSAHNMYWGAVSDAGDITTDGNRESAAITFPKMNITLPSWSGRLHLYFAQPHSVDDIILINERGSFLANQIDSFTKLNTLYTINSAPHEVWFSKDALAGSIVGGQMWEVER